MHITSPQDEFYPNDFNMKFVKRSGRWVNETSGNQMIVGVKYPAFEIECKGSTTLIIKADHREEGLLSESTRLRVIYDGESGGVTSVTKQLPDGSIEDLDWFSISIMNPSHCLFWEKPTQEL